MKYILNINKWSIIFLYLSLYFYWNIEKLKYYKSKIHVLGYGPESSQTPNSHWVEDIYLRPRAQTSGQSAKPCACVMDVDTVDPSTRMNAVGAAPQHLRVRWRAALCMRTYSLFALTLSHPYICIHFLLPQESNAHIFDVDMFLKYIQNF